MGSNARGRCGAETAIVDHSPSAPGPWSRTLWDIDWAEHLPFESEGYCAILSDYDTAKQFVVENYALIFEAEDTDSVFATDLNPTKARYYRCAGDFFEIQHDERTVGLVVCTPLDWSSYYLRSGAVLPEHRGNRLVQDLYTAVLCPVLAAAGVERMEIDISPSNFAMTHILNRLQFNQTGTLLSERFGATIHFTKFLSHEKEDVFLRQFCAGVKPQLHARNQPEGGLVERSSR